MLPTKPLKTGQCISELNEFPTDSHFAALVSESMTYDDGYGERGQSSMSTMHYLQYVYLGNKQEAIDWLQKEEDRNRKWSTGKSFKIIKVDPINIQRTVNFVIS